MGSWKSPGFFLSEKEWEPCAEHRWMAESIVWLTCMFPSRKQQKQQPDEETNGDSAAVVMCDIPSATSAFCPPLLGNYVYHSSDHGHPRPVCVDHSTTMSNWCGQPATGYLCSFVTILSGFEWVFFRPVSGRAGWLLVISSGVWGAIPSRNVSLCENFLSKIWNLGLKIHILGEFWGKIELLSSRILFRSEICSCVSKNWSFLPQYLLNPWRRWWLWFALRLCASVFTWYLPNSLPYLRGGQVITPAQRWGRISSAQCTTPM